jgi:endonuclease YncB( thermonuclease family)
MNRSTATVRRLLKFRRGAVRGSPSPPYVLIAVAVIVFLALFQWYQQRQEDQRAAQEAAAKAEKAHKKTPGGQHETSPTKNTAKNSGKQDPDEDDEPPTPAKKSTPQKTVTLQPSVTSSERSSPTKNTPSKTTTKPDSPGKKTLPRNDAPAEPEPPNKSNSDNPNAGKYRVTHVADGDTLNLEGRHRVRLIGINCPEIAHPEKDPPTRAQPWSAEAMKFTEARIKNQTVRVEFDPEYDAEDRYGRWLCWVYYRDRDGSEKLLNEELLREGLAFAYDDRRQYHYTEAMYRRLKAAQREAQDEERGIYSK